MRVKSRRRRRNREIVVLAVDPGMQGALALLNTHDILDVIDMPIAGEGAQKLVSAPTIANFIRGSGATNALVEKAQSMPEQGVAGVFRYGAAYGVCIGVIGTLEIPLELVHPSVWKRSMKLTTNKEDSRLMAINRFPSYEHLFKRKMDHNRAEAALLAEFHMKKLLG